MFLTSSKMVTALCSHGFIFSIMKSMQGQMLNFVVVFFVKEVIAKLIQDHRI